MNTAIVLKLADALFASSLQPEEATPDRIRAAVETTQECDGTCGRCLSCLAPTAGKGKRFMEQVERLHWAFDAISTAYPDLEFGHTSTARQPREHPVPCSRCGVHNRRGRIEPKHLTWNISGRCDRPDQPTTRMQLAAGGETR